MTQTPPPSSASVAELIEVEEERLLVLRRRFVALQAIDEDLRRRVGDGEFVAVNDLVWYAILDHRDVLFVHFASWVRGMVEPGGFFGQLKLGCKALYVSTPKRGLADEDAVRARRRRERFEARFPAAAARGSVNHGDVDEIKNAFWARLEPVVLDRDSFRAHPYERGGKENARMLAVAEMSVYFDYAQELMNDVRLFATDTTFGYHDSLSMMPASNVASDLVDLLLFGSIGSLLTVSGANRQLHVGSGAWWWQHRSAFLKAVRSRVDATGDPTINADEAVKAASGDVADGSLARAVTVSDPYAEEVETSLNERQSADSERTE